MTSARRNPPARPPPVPFRWVRVGHERIRSASQADLGVLAELAGGSGARIRAVRGTGFEADLWRSPPRGRILERDGRIVAGAAFAPASPDLTPGHHPWSLLAPTPSPIAADRSAPEAIVLADLVYRPAADRTGPAADWLGATARRACQRSAARRVYALVPATPPSDGGSRPSPAAVVQQLHAGALDDPLLTPFFAADFLPAGLLAPGDGPFDDWRVLMMWENTRR